MATDDMDTSGPSTEGSPPQVSPVVTSSPPSDEGLRNLVAQTIQEYCHGKLIDDHSQFQRIEAQGILRFHYLISMTVVWIRWNVRLRCCKSIMIRTVLSPPLLLESQNDSKINPKSPFWRGLIR